jgi:hypothetical protein
MRSAADLPANLWDYFIETAGYIAQVTTMSHNLPAQQNTV